MRLIDADEVDKIINKEIASTKTYIEHDAQIRIKFAIKKLPTIEAGQVVHGEWERTDITDDDGWAPYRCTCCDWHTTYYYSFSASPNHNFCPNCGADMRKGGAE